MIKTCVLLYLGLTGPMTSQGLYKLQTRLEQLPSTTVEVVYTTGSFSPQCHLKIVGGHSIGVYRALQKAKASHVDLLVAFDGYGFLWTEKPNADYTINVYAGGWRLPSLTGQQIQVQAPHVGIEGYEHERIIGYIRKLQVDLQ